MKKVDSDFGGQCFNCERPATYRENRVLVCADCQTTLRLAFPTAQATRTPPVAAAGCLGCAQPVVATAATLHGRKLCHTCQTRMQNDPQFLVSTAARVGERVTAEWVRLQASRMVAPPHRTAARLLATPRGVIREGLDVDAALNLPAGTYLRASLQVLCRANNWSEV